MNETTARVLASMTLLALLVGVVALPMWGCPKYRVYSRQMEGRAQYAEAEANRQIAVLEAQAKLEAARMLNQAEVERARGVAEANRIIGNSLKGNEGYLRYLWIQGIQGSEETQIIYVPTETGLPILEAGRFGARTTVTAATGENPSKNPE